MSNPIHREPKRLSDILGELFTVRGYGRLQARQELEAAWNAALGEPLCRQTRLGEVRHGVLSVTVAHSTLLGELAAFRKPALLAALRTCAGKYDSRHPVSGGCDRTRGQPLYGEVCLGGRGRIRYSVPTHVLASFLAQGSRSTPPRLGAKPLEAMTIHSRRSAAESLANVSNRRNGDRPCDNLAAGKSVLPARTDGIPPKLRRKT